MRLSLIMTVLFLFISSTTTHASWLIYHKPEFKGKVVDLETNEPIEGAVVVAIYEKATHGPVDTVTSSFDAREALTDNKGEFKIPSYTTFISPISTSYDVEFIIFKPGYVWERPVHLESVFSGKGTSDFDMPMMWDKDLKIIVLKSGIVKLPKAKTNRDRTECFLSLNQVSNFTNKLPIASSIKENERQYISTLEN
jgi:hypothetical protein